MQHSLFKAAALTALGLSSQANATLVLDPTVIGSFVPVQTWTDTAGNDLPNVPTKLFFGQLSSVSSGYVDFFYVGNEAAYVNTLYVNNAPVHSAYADGFNAPFEHVGSVGVSAGGFVDFGFCTDGGDSIALWGRCAYNDIAASLTAQYNAIGGAGYRSIAFRPLTSFNETTGTLTWGPIDGPGSDIWGIFWDDSGAKNDDNHDDYIAVARFSPTKVPEPATALLFGTALLGLALARRRLA